MDWLTQWIGSHGHWKWLSPSLPAALLTWLFRRRGLHPWDALIRQLNLNKEIAICRQDLSSCEESCANEQRGRREAIRALEEMVAAGTMVKRAAQDRLAIDPSSPVPTPSPATSRPSRRPRRTGPRIPR